MLILAIDTAAAACTTTLWNDGDILADVSVRQSRGHGEIIVPQIQDMLARMSLRFQDLDRIAVTRGPGSFTGLRVGLSTARAMGLGLSLPVHGVKTLDALAYDAQMADPKRCHLAALQTKRGDLYTQMFTSDGSDAAAVRSAEATEALALEADAVIIGDAQPFLEEQLANASDLTFGTPEVPSGSAVAALAAAQTEAVPPTPLYLRPAEAKLPAHGGRLRP